MPATLRLENATKTYGRTRALDGVNATFQPGQVTAVIGPNGAGKSTLLAALSTAAGLRSGEVLLDGAPLHREDTAARRRLLWVPDAPFLVQARTPIDNIATYLDAYLIDAKSPDIAARVLAQIEALHLTAVADKPTYALSRGQRYKTALAALFTIDPEIWLLDEPFASGLDAPGTNLLRREMKRAAADRGRTVVYTTQLPELTASLADRALVLLEGKLAHDLEPVPGHEALAALLEEVPPTR